jgi:hypothetical protein
MPSEKRALEKDEAGAALEPAKRPCPGDMSGDGEVKKKKKGENISGPALSLGHLRSLSLIARSL